MHLSPSGHCWEPSRDLGCLGVTHYSPFGSLVQPALQKGHGRFEWTTDLDSLAALLGISQQLDGKSPRVLEGILEVGEAVTPVAAQRALSADGNRTGVAVQMQNLRTRNTTVSMQGSIALTLDSNSPPPNMARPSLIKTDKTAVGAHLMPIASDQRGIPTQVPDGKVGDHIG